MHSQTTQTSRKDQETQLAVQPRQTQTTNHSAKERDEEPVTASLRPATSVQGRNANANLVNVQISILAILEATNCHAPGRNDGQRRRG